MIKTMLLTNICHLVKWNWFMKRTCIGLEG